MASNPHVVNRFTGLYGSVNPFSGRVPEGALEVAENVVIRSVDLMEPRRGYTASSPCVAPQCVPGTFQTDGTGGGAIPPNFIAVCAPNGTWVTCDPATMPIDPNGNGIAVCNVDGTWTLVCIPPAILIGGACVVQGG